MGGVIEECIYSVHSSEGPLTLSVDKFLLGGTDSQLQAVSAHSRKWKAEDDASYRQVDTFQNSNASEDHDWKDHKYLNLKINLQGILSLAQLDLLRKKTSGPTNPHRKAQCRRALRVLPSVRQIL